MNENKRTKVADIFLRRLGVPPLEAAGKVPPGTSQAIFDAVFHITANENVDRHKQILLQLGVKGDMIDSEIEESKKFLNTFSNKQKQFLGNRGVFNYKKGQKGLELLEQIANGKIQVAESELEKKWEKLRTIFGSAAGARNRLVLNFKEIKNLPSPSLSTNSGSNLNENNLAFAQLLENSMRMKHTDLHLTLYNGVVETRQNINNAFNLVEFIGNSGILTNISKNKNTNGYNLKLVELSGHSKSRFKKLWSISEEYFNDTKNFYSPGLGSIILKYRLSKGDKSVGVAVTIFTTGKVKISGGFIDLTIKNTNTNFSKINQQPNLVIKHIFGSGTIKYNNFGGIFKIGSIINLEKTIEKVPSSFKGTYEPELSPRATFQLENCKLQLDMSGVVQLKGMKDPIKSFNETLDFINKYVVRGADINLLKNPLKFGVGKIAKRVNSQPAPNIKKRGTTCPVGRRPTPYSFQGKCPPQTFRGKQLNGDKFYVKPNPQGQPCCYKKPKSTKYLKNKVKNQYEKAQVKVPNNVGTLFQVTAATGTNNKNNNISYNIPNIKVVNDPKFGLKIDSRQCMRYTKQKLYEYATRMKIQNLKPTFIKEELCNKIKEKAKNLKLNNTKNVVGNLAVSFTNGNKVYVITGEGKSLRLGRRLCHTYTKPDLLKFARRFGTDANTSMSKEKICLEFEKKLVQLKKNKQAAVNKKQTELASKKKKAIENRIKKASQLQKKKNEAAAKQKQENLRIIRTKLGLTKNVILLELPKLYGAQFMKKYGNRIRPTFNEQANYIIQLLRNEVQSGRLNIRRNGLPKKEAINRFKKIQIENWKKSTEEVYAAENAFKNNLQNARNDLRKVLGSNYNKVKNLVTNEIVRKYKNHVQKIAKTRNINGKLPSKKQIEKRKQLWVRLERNYGALKKSPTPPSTSQLAAQLSAMGVGVTVEEI
jgi:hypothetical protein